MSTTKPTETMTEVLRRAIVESGETYLGLSKATGLARASIQRFVDGRNSLRLDLADRLATYFGLQLTQAKVNSTTKGRQR
jgi:plasmid maintenance system antidote protein VapI